MESESMSVEDRNTHRIIRKNSNSKQSFIGSVFVCNLINYFEAPVSSNETAFALNCILQRYAYRNLAIVGLLFLELNPGKPHKLSNELGFRWTIH